MLMRGTGKKKKKIGLLQRQTRRNKIQVLNNWKKAGGRLIAVFTSMRSHERRGMDGKKNPKGQHFPRQSSLPSALSWKHDLKGFTWMMGTPLAIPLAATKGLSETWRLKSPPLNATGILIFPINMYPWGCKTPGKSPRCIPCTGPGPRGAQPQPVPHKTSPSALSHGTEQKPCATSLGMTLAHQIPGNPLPRQLVTL